MMVRKEDRTQILKLGGAIVAVFGCAAWRVVGATQAVNAPPPASAAPPADGTPAASTSTPAPTAVASAASSPSKPDDGKIELPRRVATSGVDPFRTIVVPKTNVAVAVAPKPLPAPTGAFATLPLPTGNLTTQPVPVATPVPESQTAIRVTGIVAGPNATAILEIDKETRVVHEGTTLKDGTVVVRIEPTTVTVRREKKTETLDVGD